VVPTVPKARFNLQKNRKKTAKFGLLFENVNFVLLETSSIVVFYLEQGEEVH